MPLIILRCATSSCVMDQATVQREVTAITPTPRCAEPPWHYYHKSRTNRPIMKTENKLNPSHRATYSNRATPLMDLNLPTHNHPQTTTASIKPLTHHFPSYIAHSYQAPTAPQPPSVSPIPQQSTNPTQSTAVFLEQMNALKQANVRNAPSTKPTDYDYQPGIATNYPSINTVVTLPHIYSFIFLNAFCLFTKLKLKYKVLPDLCGPSTLFLCLCETFLMDSINDSEIQIPGFSIVRCDRLLREGGGICIYVRNTKSFSVLFEIIQLYM